MVAVTSTFKLVVLAIDLAALDLATRADVAETTAILVASADDYCKNNGIRFCSRSWAFD